MKLIIMRGCPGSGKSTFARANYPHAAVFSSDDLFMVNGEYKFEPTKLREYHAENQRRVREALASRQFPIVCVDNTNTQVWEMVPYVQAADEFGYTVEIIEPKTPWAWNAEELAQRNTHGVPLEVIARMLARYEHAVTPDIIRSSARR